MFVSKVFQRYKSRNIIPILNFLLHSQYWSLEKIQAFQFEKIKKLINHAYLNVPYYHQLFKNIGIKPSDIQQYEDFKSIPILTKDIIRQNFNDLKASNLQENDFIPNSTGGSTGEPLHFYQDTQYANWADAARIRGWYNLAGCSYGDSCAVLWGAMRDIKEDFNVFERLRDYLLTGEIWLNAFNLSEDRKLDFIKLIKILRPKLLRGYVSAIKDLATYVENCKIYFPPLKGIILGAETVDSATQEYIEQIFKTTSYNTYGGRELSLMAMECSNKNGLHEISENNYIELEKIKISNYQNAGNIIVTNLNNYAMPFIRYRIGDIAIPNENRICNCGRGLPLIGKIIGRTTEVFIFYDGSRIAGEMFIHLMKDFPVIEYQFVQTSESSILLKLTKNNLVNEKIEEKIRSTYKSFLPDKVKFDIEKVEKIKKTETGKFRFVLKQFNQ